MVVNRLFEEGDGGEGKAEREGEGGKGREVWKEEGRQQEAQDKRKKNQSEREEEREESSSWCIANFEFPFQMNRSERVGLKNLSTVDASQGRGVNSGLCLHATFSRSTHSPGNPLQAQRNRAYPPTHSSQLGLPHTGNQGELSPCLRSTSSP